MVLDHSGPQRNCGGPSRQLQPENSGDKRLRRRRFPQTADRNWRGKAEPDRDSKTGVSAGYRFFWGRHGFDGNGCGQEACRGSRTLNRVKKTQLPTLNWLTQLN
jgi:hypothetical protein